MRDGEPGEPDVTLSPFTYHYQHRGEIEAVVQGADRDATFDTLCANLGAAPPPTGRWAVYAIGSKRKHLGRSICPSREQRA